jgi:hypothetical protein
MKDAETFAARAIEAVRELSDHYGCRIEICSDTVGSLGKFCVTASDGDRMHQGFGGTVAEAVDNMRRQPVRCSSSNQTRTRTA